MLYVVTTPIGNLKDITYRAIEVLQNCDYILSEDTRRSSILLNHYGIKKSLISFHMFNEKKREAKVLEDLQDGKNIALISDSGTPLISDPGSRLVKACIEKNIAFTAIPGPCSVIQSLVLAGLGDGPFQFLGFFSKKMVKKALEYEGNSIFFESPYRILKTLKLLEKNSPEREVVITREMTKLHEEAIRGKVRDVRERVENSPLKGEIVLIIKSF